MSNLRMKMDLMTMIHLIDLITLKVTRRIFMFVSLEKRKVMLKKR